MKIALYNVAITISAITVLMCLLPRSFADGSHRESLSIFESDNGYFGLCNPEGDIILDPKYIIYDDPTYIEFIGDDGYYIIYDPSNHLFGYYDKEYDFLCLPKYTDIMGSNGRGENNLLGVRDTSTGLYGYINSSNDKLLIPYLFTDESSPFKHGIAIGRCLDGKQFILHENGTMYQFSDGYLSGFTGVMDTLIYSNMINGTMLYGVTDIFGVVLIPSCFDDLWYNTIEEQLIGTIGEYSFAISEYLR